MSEKRSIVDMRTKCICEFLTMNSRASDASRSSLTRYCTGLSKSPIEGTIRIGRIDKVQMDRSSCGSFARGRAGAFVHALVT